MATVTIITEQLVDVAQQVSQVSATIPAGKRLAGAYIINLPGYTEELGISGHQLTGSNVTTDLQGMDSVGSQHQIAYQFAEDVDINTAGGSSTELTARVTALEKCSRSICKQFKRFFG
jgi:hypothetical protein